MNRALGRGLVLIATAVTVIGATTATRASATAKPPSMTMSPMRASGSAAGVVAPAIWVRPPAVPGTARASAAGVSTSVNWSGYVQEGTGFTGAHVDWTVPTVTPSTTDKYSSAWVGVDGAQNTSLIQLGTEQDSINGVARYYAWWEILPAPAVAFAPVSPGDHIEAQVLQKTPGTWVMTLLDLTQNQGFTQTVSYSGAGTSAEFILESPSSCSDVSCNVLPLANFGTINFASPASTGSPAVTFPLDMVDASNTVIAHTSTLDAQSSFTVSQPSIQPPPPPPTLGPGYWMVGSNGDVFPFGAAHFDGSLNGQGTAIVKIEPTPDFGGYWLLDALGHVFPYGDAANLGNAAGRLAPAETATSLSSTRDGKGYWIFTNQGRALPFGDAPFYGDLSGVSLNGPVLGSTVTASGRGYYMVASDGGIFSFGDAVFHGSTGNTRLNQPVMSMVPTKDGGGYWLVASDGGIFSFGDAAFQGSLGGIRLNKPVVGMVRYGDGYLMVGADGGIFDFSSSPFLGSLGANSPVWPIVSVASQNT
jgi:hypothetical protein